MECPVCMTGYDETVRRPRSMPCGHTICSTCIDGIVDEGHATCPTCRISNAVPKGGQFPVNYVVEDLLWRLKDSSSSSSSAATAGASDCPLETPCLSGTISSLLQQQETKVLAAISTCQKVQAQLDQFQTTLADWCQQQQHLENSLQTSRELVQQNELKVAAKNEVVKKGEQMLNAALEALRKINSPQAAYAAIDNAEKCTDEEEKSAKESQGMLLEVADATTDAAKKITKALHVVLEAIQRVQATHETVAIAELKPKPGPHAARTVTVGLEELMAPPTIMVGDLRKLILPAKRLLADGKAFAFQSVNNVKKYFRMSISGCRVFLHVPQNMPLPLGAAIVQP
ncbi:tripartite motif-containing protein 2-like isoform X2 [Eriocheir sinensis]|uniref:tripartite motif-containing protein 2-like isoform X2 n=1 Tax=Eriocheir sinensis TaxID=95602 RepID=UPI0021C9AF1A|nr:tripartite motif-containing protein 2-like isoform X2 [Eriocheir sinensis]